MIFSTFKITSLPKHTILKIDGVNAITNYDYHISLFQLMQIENNENIRGVNFDKFTYMLLEEKTKKWTNNISINISSKADENTPESVNNTIVANQNEVVNIFSDLPINSSVDRIKIINKSKYLKLFLDSKRFYGDELNFIDLKKLNIGTDESGGEPQSYFEYLPGNHLKYGLPVLFNINVLTKVEIRIKENYSYDDEIEISGTIYKKRVKRYLLELYNAYNDVDINIKNEISNDLLDENTENYVNFVDVDHKEFDNNTFIYDTRCEENGKKSYYIDIIRISNDIDVVDKNIDITVGLESMNLDVSLVGINNSITINEIL